MPTSRSVVADFSVRGGADSALGTAVAEAVHTRVAPKSSAITVMPASAIREALQARAGHRPRTVAWMRRWPAEIAQRQGLKGVVTGQPHAPGAWDSW